MKTRRARQAAATNLLQAIAEPLEDRLAFLCPEAAWLLSMTSKYLQEKMRAPRLFVYMMEAAWYGNFRGSGGEIYGAFYWAETLRGPTFETGRGACGGQISLAYVDPEQKTSNFGSVYYQESIMELLVTCCAPALVDAVPRVKRELEAANLSNFMSMGAPGHRSPFERTTTGISFSAQRDFASNGLDPPPSDLVRRLPRATRCFPRELILQIAKVLQSCPGRDGRIGKDDFEWATNLLQAKTDDDANAILDKIRIVQFHYAHPYERADLAFDHFFFEYVAGTPGNRHDLGDKLKEAGLYHAPPDPEREDWPWPRYPSTVGWSDY